MKRAFRLSVLLLALAFCAVFSSCSLYDVLGIDTHDYENEPMTAELATDGEVADAVRASVRIMVQNTPYLSAFDTPAAAAELYRDGVLCTVLANNYSKYNANADLIAKTREAYPTLQITTVIPAVDFESTVYRYFGGTASVGNASTKRFTYLPIVDAYVSVGIGVQNDAEVVIERLYETENTYVCVFYNVMNGQHSDTYRMLCMKREDGTFYMRALQVVTDE